MSAQQARRCFWLLRPWRGDAAPDGQAAPEEGSPFNPEGRAGEALGDNPADPDEPIAVARYNNAGAHQVEQN